MPISGNLGGFIKPGFNPLAVGPERPPLVGGLYDVGNNSHGQLGKGDTTNRSSLVQVGALTTWINIAAAYQHTVATNQTNELWAIGGRNIYGELGLGDTTSRSSPVQVGALTNWSNVSSGAYYNFAVKTDGTLYAWGYNAYGQLGDGTTTNRSSPVQVGALTTWSKISCGQYHGLAIKTDGTLWSWGQNTTYGALGDGTTTNRNSPVQVGALTTWSQVVGGGQFSLAIKTDGTLWSWGNNGSGRLGQGNTTSYSSPVQVGALTTWNDLDTVPSIGGGAQSTFAIKADSTLWAWGNNNKGQLGQGNTTDYSSPVQVGALTTWLRLAATGFTTGLYAVNEE